MRTKRATLMEGWSPLRLLQPLTVEGDEGEGGDGDAGAGGPAGKGDTSKEGLAALVSEGEGEGDGDGEGAGGDGDGEGGDAAGAGDGGDDDGGKGEGEGDGAEPKALTFKDRPDWVPEQFYDKKTGVVDAEKMAKSWGDLRGKMAKGADKAPKDAADYTVEMNDIREGVADDLLGFRDEEGNDGPAMDWFRATAKEIGLNKDQFDTLVGGYLDQMQEILPAPIDAQAELKKLGNKGQQILDGQARWLNGLRDKGVLSEPHFERVSRLLVDAEGVLALASMRTMFEGYQIPADIQVQDAGSEGAAELREQLAALMEEADAGKAGAQQRYERLMEKYNTKFGTAPAGTSRNAA